MKWETNNKQELNLFTEESSQCRCGNTLRPTGPWPLPVQHTPGLPRALRAVPVVRVSTDSSFSSGGELANSLKAKQETKSF